MQPAPTVEDYGGRTLPNGIAFNGWTFETSEGSIASAAELAELKRKMTEAAATNEALPKLPEAIFANNRLVMTHVASKQSLTFDAEGCLTDWLKNSLKHGAGGLTIPAASLGSWKEKVQQQTGDSTRPDWDWTFTNSYSGIGADADGGPLAWAKHGGDGIDMQLLRKREPILFFADLPFYTDDLHDNGLSETRLRIRVMPSCFFVLLRHYLRVDGSLIRQRDARFFVRFSGGGGGPPKLIRLLRLGTCALPPLPTAPPEDGPRSPGGTLVEGGTMDTPRPNGVPGAQPLAILPDEQTAADKLGSLPAEMEIVEELTLEGAASVGSMTIS